MAEVTEGKLYDLKSSAVRAARKAGYKDDQFDVSEKDGKWSYRVKKNAKASMKEQFDKTSQKHRDEDAKAKAKVSPVGKQTGTKLGQMDTPPLPDGRTHDEDVATELGKLVPTEVVATTPKPVRQLTVDEQLRKDMEEVQRRRVEEHKNRPTEPPPPTVTLPPEKDYGDAKAKPKPAPRVVLQTTDNKKAGKSTVQSPTKLVWHIADELKAKGVTSRKLVIAECVKRGITFYTARTQYQAWLSENRESEKNAAKANGSKLKQK